MCGHTVGDAVSRSFFGMGAHYLGDDVACFLYRDGVADTDVLVNMDGRSFHVPAGTGVELKPGESITLWPHQYHDFDVKPGTGDVLIGEVSMCNDDNTDNRFYEPVGRFPTIEEDEEPYRLLCNEYPPAK